MFRTLLLLALLSAGALQAQDSTFTGIPRLTLKTNVTTLLNPAKTSAMLTADLRLARRLSLDAGGGAFLFSSVFADDDGEYYRGLRARGGIKYFPVLKPDFSWHIGIEAKHNNVNHRYWERVLRQGGQFEQILLLQRRVQSTGAALRTGVQFYLGDDKRLLLDLYIGMGFLANHVTETNRPPDAEPLFFRDFQFFSERSFRYLPGRSIIADYLMGMHIGYSFW